MPIHQLSIADITASEQQAQAAERLLEQVANLESILLPDDAWDNRQLRSSLEQYGAGVMLWIEDGRVAGYCVYQIVFETGEIHRIGTHPDFARRGIAMGLIDALIDLMKKENSEQLLLEVNANNHRAIGLYQKAGFRQIDVRKNYYKLQDGQKADALIMQKSVLGQK